ncbi:hypothetical protein EBU71_07775 [bacterium]|nr:hypothetical protein [Candidatus Elulimicrobium humile]
MAYPVKKFSTSEYLNLPSDSYEYTTKERIYYIPELTDSSATWTVNVYDYSDPEGSPLYETGAILETGYRVLILQESSGSAGSIQTHTVISSGFDGQVYADATNNFLSLPLGLVTTWSDLTFSYTASLGTVFGSGRYLNGVIEPPTVGTILTTQFPSTGSNDYRVLIYNNDILTLNEVFQSIDYSVDNLLIKIELFIPPPPPVETAPIITLLPILSPAVIGSNVSSTAATASGTPSPTLTYTLYRNGVALSGYIGVSLTNINGYIYQISDSDASFYVRVTATNTVGSVSGNSNTVTVPTYTVAPIIVTAPTLSAATIGSNISCTAGSATGTPSPTLTYTLYRDGVAVPSYAGVSLGTINSYVYQISDSGADVYVRLTATNSAGTASANSNTVTVPVYTVAPTITSAPVLSAGIIGSNVSCTAGSATGTPTPTLTYTLYRDGVAVPSYIDVSLGTINSYVYQISDGNISFYVMLTATNSAGTDTENSNTVTIPTYTEMPIITTPPVLSAAVVGSNANSTSGAATGTPTPSLTYILLRNGVAVSGYNAVNLATINGYNYQSSDAGVIFRVRLTATNSVGSVSADSDPVTVQEAPSITVAPVLSGATIGSNVNCTAGSATGTPTPTLSYTLYRNGVAVSGYNNVNLSTINGYTYQISDSDASFYVQITATNIIGSDTENSNTVTVPTYTVAPSITVAPVLSAATIGSNVSCTAGSATGTPTPTLTYTLYRDGVAVPSYVSVSLGTINSYVYQIADSDLSFYVTLTATNSAGSDTENSNTVIVPTYTVAPTITSAPVLDEATVGSNVSCSAAMATGTPTPTLTYTLYRSGVAISGYIDTTLTTINSYVYQSGDAGLSFYVMATATNSAGSDTEISNTIIVSQAPSITVAPVLSAATVGFNVSCTAGTVTGYPTPTLTYSLIRNGTVVTGRSSVSLSTINGYTYVSSDAGASFYVELVAINTAGFDIANSNTVTVQQAPSITVAPVLSAATVGSNVSCTAGTVTGYPTPTLTYTLYRDGIIVSGYNDVSLSTVNSYTYQSSDAGSDFYVRLTATNINGTATSNSNTRTAEGPPIVVAPVLSVGTVGSTVSSTAGSATGYPAITSIRYDLLRNGSVVSGYNNVILTTINSYVYQSVDGGQSFSVRIRAVNSVGTTTADSNTIAVQQTPSIITAPVLDAALIGATLNCTAGTASGTPTPTLTYTLYRNGSPVIGYQNVTHTQIESYVYQRADSNSTMYVELTATNVVGSASANSNTVTVELLYFFGGMYASDGKTAEDTGLNQSGPWYIRIRDINGVVITGIPSGGRFTTKRSGTPGSSTPAIIGSVLPGYPGIYQVTSNGLTWWNADLNGTILEVGDVGGPDELNYIP